MANSKSLTGTPWHTTVLTKAPDDDRRHKSRCIYYQSGNEHCKFQNIKCCGSAHCDYYKENVFEAQKGEKVTRIAALPLTPSSSESLQFSGMKSIRITDIIIDSSYLKTKPAQSKIDSLIQYYSEHKKLDKPIIVSICGRKYKLEDKYLRFYVAQKLSLTEIPAIIGVYHDKSINNVIREKGQKVSHTTYGCGEVTESTLDTVTIRFLSGKEVKFGINECIQNNLLKIEAKKQKTEGEFMRQPEWNQYEAALLIETYLQMKADQREKRIEYISDLSCRLREAQGKKNEIDETYRNINGITLRLGEIDRLFCDGVGGLKNTSQLFVSMVQKYRESQEEYQKILDIAHQQYGHITVSKPVQQDTNIEKNVVDEYVRTDDDIDKKETYTASEKEFFDWLKNCENMADASCRSYVSSLRSAEEYAAQHEFDGEKIYSAESEKVVELLQSLMRDEAFLSINQTQHNRFSAAFRKFASFQFGKDFSDSLFASHNAKTPETEERTNALYCKISSEQVLKAEEIVIAADMNGVTFDELQHSIGVTATDTWRIIAKSSHIVEIHGRFLHDEAFVDWQDGANHLESIFEKLMQKNNGYISIGQLYEYARAEMNMFLNDNDMNDERSVYDIAKHLFEKVHYHEKQYSFYGNMHISKTDEIVGTNLDVIKKYAHDQGGAFTFEGVEDYLSKVGIKTSNLRGQMKVYDEPIFFYCEEGLLILAESMGIDDTWKQNVKKALHDLFDDFEGHVVLRSIPSMWFEHLPQLPGNCAWTPLLLQSVLRFYGSQLGARTISAMEGQAIETVHTMLVKNEDQIQNFGDVVIWFLTEHNLKRTFEAEELRCILVSAGILHGNELITNMPKALKGDGRFAWDAAGEKVEVIY